MKILFFSGYNFTGIQVSLEFSLLSYFYLLCFLLYLTFTFYDTDIEKSYVLRVISYDTDKFNYFKNFIFSFYCWTFYRIYQLNLSVIFLILSEIFDVQQLFSPPGCGPQQMGIYHIFV